VPNLLCVYVITVAKLRVPTLILSASEVEPSKSCDTMPNTENELPPQAHTVKLDPQSRSKQFKVQMFHFFCICLPITVHCKVTFT